VAVLATSPWDKGFLQNHHSGSLVQKVVAPGEQDAVFNGK
jgi:hypothetical protein